MSKELVKQICHIAKKYKVETVAIMTNHLKIKGKLANCPPDDESDCILTLNDAKTWLLEDLCKCSDQKCGRESHYISHSEWLGINADKIVSFSIYK